MDLNKILAGDDPAFDLLSGSDPDLKEIRFSGQAPATLEGGYRVISDMLIDGVIADDVKADLEGLTAKRTVGIARIDLQTNNYFRNRSGAADSPAFPCDESVEYGRVAYDFTDHLRVYPQALVIGSLDKAVTAAVKWKQSGRYLLIPYIANIYNISTSFRTPNDGLGKYLRWVSAYQAHICLGDIRSGNLSDWAFNSDLAAGYDGHKMASCPPGFLPVFVPQYGNTPLRQLQDAELARVLAGFMPKLKGEQHPRTVERILCDSDPEIRNAVESYRGGAGELPAGYRENKVYDRVYALYIKMLADTFLDIWDHSVKP